VTGLRPICFMVMPYGTKTTSVAAGSSGPTAINFDRLWQAAFQPAIADLGYEPVRADQDGGALIIHEMIERLAMSDLVIADMSIPNGNVYYELGIRHAAKQRGCVMIAADWAQPLFDVNQMRQVRYSLPAEFVDDATADTIRAHLCQQIPPLSAGDSPVFATFPEFPTVDSSRATTFRQALLQLSRLQGEISSVRNTPLSMRRARALALQQRYYAGSGPIQIAVAMELVNLLRDATDWPTTLAFIESLPPDVQEHPAMREGRALAQSGSGDHWSAIAALESLIQLRGDSSERRGLLGGRFKRLFDAAETATDRAEYLDLTIAAYERGMRLDLNDYYPSSNLPRLLMLRDHPGDRERAREVANIAREACMRSMDRHASDGWARSTLLGLAFDVGDVAIVRDLALQVRREGPSRWMLNSTLGDLRRSLSLHQGDTLTDLAEVLSTLEGMIQPE
jgi:hypothetical protein